MLYFPSWSILPSSAKTYALRLLTMASALPPSGKAIIEVSIIWLITWAKARFLLLKCLLGREPSLPRSDKLINLMIPLKTWLNLIRISARSWITLRSTCYSILSSLNNSLVISNCLGLRSAMLHLNLSIIILSSCYSI